MMPEEETPESDPIDWTDDGDEDIEPVEIDGEFERSTDDEDDTEED